MRTGAGCWLEQRESQGELSDGVREDELMAPLTFSAPPPSSPADPLPTLAMQGSPLHTLPEVA